MVLFDADQTFKYSQSYGSELRSNSGQLDIVTKHSNLCSVLACSRVRSLCKLLFAENCYGFACASSVEVYRNKYLPERLSLERLIITFAVSKFV